MDEMEENRYTYGIREYYKLRKETIARNFALAKELHGFRNYVEKDAKTAKTGVLSVCLIRTPCLSPKPHQNPSEAAHSSQDLLLKQTRTKKSTTKDKKVHRQAFAKQKACVILTMTYITQNRQEVSLCAMVILTMSTGNT